MLKLTTLIYFLSKLWEYLQALKVASPLHCRPALPWTHYMDLLNLCQHWVSALPSIHFSLSCQAVRWICYEVGMLVWWLWCWLSVWLPLEATKTQAAGHSCEGFEGFKTGRLPLSVGATWWQFQMKGHGRWRQLFPHCRWQACLSLACVGTCFRILTKAEDQQPGILQAPKAKRDCRDIQLHWPNVQGGHLLLTWKMSCTSVR